MLTKYREASLGPVGSANPETFRVCCTASTVHNALCACPVKMGIVIPKFRVEETEARSTEIAPVVTQPLSDGDEI